MPLGWRSRLLSSPGIRHLLFKIVKHKTRAKTHGNYPATEKIIQVVRRGIEKGREEGYRQEARAFGKLVMTPESAALRHLFFASNALKKTSGSASEAKPIHRVGILGGGLMGGGIASVTATRGQLPVRIKDINEQGINHALKYNWQLLTKRVQSKRMKPTERQRLMTLISGSTDYRGFEHADIVIEAVFEDLALKRQMVVEIEDHAAPHTILHQIPHRCRSIRLQRARVARSRSLACTILARWTKCRWLRLSRTPTPAQRRLRRRLLWRENRGKLQSS